MNNFIFSIPTTAYFGKGQISVLGEAIKNHGGSKVLLAYGGGSIKANGIHAATIEQLKKTGLAYVELGGIQPNPRVESVEAGIKLYRDNGCDFILAVGGGSTLDALQGHCRRGETYWASHRSLSGGVGAIGHQHGRAPGDYPDHGGYRPPKWTWAGSLPWVKITRKRW